VQRCLDEGRQHVAQQRERVAVLQADGHDSTLAETLLIQLIETLAQMERLRDGFSEMLAAQERPW
jgi:hypothetical protein